MASNRQAGFSLVEMLVAMLILSFVLLGTVPMFTLALGASKSSAEMSDMGVAAVKQLETLRTTAFNSLTAGGDLTSNAAGFSDVANLTFDVRWEIVDNASPPTIKTIRVRAVSTVDTIGVPKVVEYTTRRAK